MIDHVAHDDGNEHRADVNGEAEAADLREPDADEVADADAEHEQQEAVDEVVGVGVVMCVIGILLLDLLDELVAQMIFDDELAGDRSAKERAEDEAEGRGGDGDRRSADRAGGVKVGADTGRGAGAADHRDGAAGKAEERVLAHEGHHAAADHILQNDHHDAQDEQHDDGLAALEQQRDAHGEADCCKEHDHEDGLQRVIEGDDCRPGGIKNGVEDREAKAADQGSGNAEATEHGDILRQHQAERVHRCAKGQGMVHIELDLCHVVWKPPSVNDISLRHSPEGTHGKCGAGEGIGHSAPVIG